MDAAGFALLVEGTRSFLADARAALREPARAKEACARLLEAVGETLPAAVDDAGAGPADDVLRKRLAEAEGALLHLRLALARADPAAPTFADTAARALRGVGAAFDLWAAALAEARGWAAPDIARAGTRERLMLARDCLHAHETAAAFALLRPLAEEPGADAAGAEGALDAWLLLDRVERALNQPPRPSRDA